MAATSPAFEERVSEINVLVRLLEVLEADRSGLPLRPKNKDKCLHVMKASLFLALYNAVEFVVSSTFQSVYDEIAKEQRPYLRVTEAFRDVWWHQAFAQIHSDSANRKTYVDRARVIGESIAASESVTLTARELPISGNIDAQKIRNLFDQHGMRLTVHHKAFGCVELAVVRSKRNDLAHGVVSFAECGRDYTASDLKRIATQVLIFLRGVVTSSTKFISDGAYRV